MKHSALFQTHQRAGARFAVYQAWEVPEAFAGAAQEAAAARSGAGLADVSWLTKLDLKGFGLKAAPALVEANCWQLGACHYLATCDPGEREAVLEQIHSLGGGTSELDLPPPVYCTDVTSVYAALMLAGPASRRVLRKLTSLNVSEAALPDGGCAQAGLAHVHAIVLRRDLGGLPGFVLLVSREYAESVWEAVLHAGHEFHLTTFGLEATRLLMS